MTSSDPRSGRLHDVSQVLLPWFVMAAAFAHALAVSWRKWGDLLGDTGRELDLPRRLAEGQLLYRDVRFFFGPMAPYVNAALYRLFGVHLDVLVWAGIVSAALMCAALYRLGRFFMSRWASAAIVVAFIYLCAFAHLYAGPIFNFVLPYAFTATYGIVAATWSLVFLIEHLRTGKPRAFYASAALLGLTAFSKFEVLAPAAAAHAVFVASLVVERPRRPGVYFRGYAAAVLVVFATYDWLAVLIGPDLWRTTLMDIVNQLGVVNPGSRKFQLWAMGFDDPATSLQAVGVSLALFALTLGLASAAARSFARHAPATALGAGLVMALAAATFIGFRAWQLEVHFRALPLLMLAAIVVLAVLYAKHAERRTELLPHGLLWVFAFAALWRILLNCRPHHYGFFLLPPSLVCLGVLFFDYGPRWAGPSPWSRRVFAAAGLGLLSSSVSIAYADSERLYALHTYDLVTPRGQLQILNSWGLEGPVVHALSKLPARSRVLVIPEGAGLVYFAGLREGDTMTEFLPMEIAGEKADEDLLARWRGNPPDYVVFAGIPLAEYGSAGFGADYATRALGWIDREYIPMTNPAAPIVIMRRRQRTPAADLFLELRPSPEPPGSRRTITGQVLETVDSGAVTFVRLRTDTSKIWVGVRHASLSVGSTITMTDVRPSVEPGLRRRFETVFAGRIAPNGPAAP